MILLDTHAWVWWGSDPEQLSIHAAAAIEEAVAQNQVLVSAISAWEVALLVERGRLELTIDLDEWLERNEAVAALRFIAVDHRIAVAATRLPAPLHRDPADRILAATARALQVPLVTRDRRLLDYPHVDTIW